MKNLILPGESFLVEGRPAFILLPPQEKRRQPQPWILYAPTLPAYPDQAEKWMHEQFLSAGVAVAGIDVGEAYGSPHGRELFTALYRELTERRGFAAKPCLLGRSRGGLWVSSWAIENPDKVAALAGIYPVFDWRTYPGLDKAAPAYGMTPAELEAKAPQLNPVARLDVLARAKIPVFIIHGDDDKIVPLKENSAELVARYKAAGAGDAVTLVVAKGQGHNFWEGFFRCRELVDFAIAHALGNPALPGDRAIAVEPDVRLIRTPNGGIQPRAAVDAKGMVHLIYYKGDAAAGDLFYTRSADGAVTFGEAIRVNSQPGSAIAVGTIRGAQMAIGRDGRPHVAWNGSGKTVPPAAKGEHATPMLYARLNDAGTAFEPQRNLMTTTHALDGGGSVAADANGNVYVVWHGVERGKPVTEQSRSVWIARSSDDGKTFSPEQRAGGEATGACACCGMGAAIDSRGRLLVMFRTAPKPDQRDMRLIISSDQGRTFRGVAIDGWNIAQCPMSSTTITPGLTKPVVAWETDNRVYMKPINADEGDKIEGDARIAALSKRNAKHPAVAVNGRGDALLVWTEGTGWNRGGSIAWQVYDATGKPVEGRSGRVDGLPVWSYAEAFARPDGGFVVVY